MAERTILITGASSGLGLAFLHHYVSQPSTSVIGLDINPLSATSFPNVISYQTDITSSPDLGSIARRLESKGTKLDLLIHSAGIRGLVPEIGKEKKDVAAAETWQVMNQETMMRTLETNTWGTFNVIKAFLPCLLRGSTSEQSNLNEISTSPPKVLIMSSRMGSLAANIAGGGYAYRASKAALNAIVKSFAVDVPGVVFVMMHPGRVETGLVEWKEDGAFTAQEVLGDCVGVIEKADLSWSGSFVDRWGKRIEW
jgi:NAD(P)-dependent dehydrogenase (short-subunit alcohol dehydrogenase family)